MPHTILTKTVTGFQEISIISNLVMWGIQIKRSYQFNKILWCN